MRITAASCLSKYWIVGRAATMRASSVIRCCSSRGTLKSTRTRTRLPITSISRTVFLFIVSPFFCSIHYYGIYLAMFHVKHMPLSLYGELDTFLSDEVGKV